MQRGLGWLEPIRGDLGAALLTLLCAIHCLSAPFLAGVLPLLVAPRFEAGMSLGLVVLSFAVTLKGSLRHGSWASFALLALGYAALGAKLGGDTCCRTSSENTLLIGLSCGGILGAHVLNAGALLRSHRARACEVDCCNPSSEGAAEGDLGGGFAPEAS